MKTLIVGQHAGVFRDLDSVIRELCRRGHQVVLLHGEPLDNPTLLDVTGVTSGERPLPSEGWPRRLRVGRQVINRGIYLRKEHPSPERVVSSLEKDMPDDTRAKFRTPLWRSAIGTRTALRGWRWIEAASPASPTVLSRLRAIDPDVMLVSPAVSPKDPVEADYLHAGRTLGITTIGCPNSWDDLTSKGTTHVLPDMFLAWNEALAQEAAEIHDIPAGTICEDDSFMVKGLSDALAREFGVGAPALIVIPHQSGQPASSQEYFDQLAHATCVFGLNTPAFLDAVVANRPCLTIVNETYWPAQGRTGHFRHLLKGKFLEVCRTMDDVAGRVRRIMDGADERAADRR